ncbi:MAG: glycosyltransferase family 2 protein, partial [Turicibacter sp.]
SDDYIEPTMYETLYNKAIADDSDIVVCDFSMDWESKNYSQPINGLKNGHDNHKRQLLISPGSAWTKLYKKSLFMDHDIQYPIGLWYEDLATTGKLILHSQTVSYVEESLLHYIQREGSIMSSMSPKIFDIYTALESIEMYYRNHDQFDEYQKEIEYMYIENLALYATLRFLKLPKPNQKIEVKKLLTYMKQKFPNWSANPYIKTLSKKDQFTLYLFYYNLVPVLKTLVKIRQSLKK